MRVKPIEVSAQAPSSIPAEMIEDEKRYVVVEDSEWVTANGAVWNRAGAEKYAAGRTACRVMELVEPEPLPEPLYRIASESWRSRTLPLDAVRAGMVWFDANHAPGRSQYRIEQSLDGGVSWEPAP